VLAASTPFDRADEPTGSAVRRALTRAPPRRRDRRFSDKHGFRKPNDERALKLMDRAAQSLMDEYPDIVLGFGESDEYSYVSPVGSTRVARPLRPPLTASRVRCCPVHFLPQIPDPTQVQSLLPTRVEARLAARLALYLGVCLPLVSLFPPTPTGRFRRSLLVLCRRRACLPGILRTPCGRRPAGDSSRRRYTAVPTDV
jgi:hypothetical protein